MEEEFGSNPSIWRPGFTVTAQRSKRLTGVLRDRNSGPRPLVPFQTNISVLRQGFDETARCLVQRLTYVVSGSKTAPWRLHDGRPGKNWNLGPVRSKFWNEENGGQRTKKKHQKVSKILTILGSGFRHKSGSSKSDGTSQRRPFA